jgi:hypothetical protein
MFIYMAEEASVGTSELAQELGNCVNKKEFSDICFDVSGTIIYLK